MSYLFVSGWKRDQGKGGITQYSFDAAGGTLKALRTWFEDVKFNVTCLDGETDILYALSEVPDLPGLRYGGGGSIYAFRMDRSTGDCRQVDIFPAYIANPCNLSLSADGNYFLVSGHGTRNYVTQLVRDAFGEYRPSVLVDDTPVVLFERTADGSVGRIADICRHTGGGPTPKQTTARPHSVTRSPSGRLYAVCDKGNDHIYMYRIDGQKGRLILCGAPTAVPPGTEPRYCVYHPRLPFLYHNCENSTEVFAYRYDEEGRISLIGRFEGLENPELRARSRIVEQQGLCMHPSGLYLYSAIHGPNQIAVFGVGEDGTLTLLQNRPVDYDWPRGIALSPDGRFLVVACARGNQTVVYPVREDGRLLPACCACDQDNAAYATFWNVSDGAQPQS